jgi:hypothetical protein
MLCEMEDTLAEGFKGHRQLPYAHWICFLIRCACDLPAEIRAESPTPRQLSLSMTYDSYGPLSPESRHLDRVSIRE